MYKTQSEGVISTVRVLEKSKNVKNLIKDLYSHITKKKKEFNSIAHAKAQLKSDIESLQQKLADLSVPEKATHEKEKKIESMVWQLEGLQQKIMEESFYGEVLIHMAEVRKQNLDAIEEPLRTLKIKMMHASSTAQTLDKETDYHMTVARTIKLKLSKLQETINSQRQSMRETLNQELHKYEERCKAIAFFRQSQETWYKKKIYINKNIEIKELEAIETEILKGKKLIEELELTQIQTMSKENKIAEALKNTSSHSLNDLNTQLIELKETKTNLISLRNDLENRINKQKEEITNLNDFYRKSNDFRNEEDFGHHKLYDIDAKLYRKQALISVQEFQHNKIKDLCSTALLGIQRLMKKAGLEEYKNFRSIKEAIDCLCDKI
jgi:DNA repair exonuclease SbcCD ATPase subunit